MGAAAGKGFNCAVENLSDNFTQIAIQGPNAVKVLQKLTDADLSQVKFYWFTCGTVCGLPKMLIARTGYTAEDGFEIYIPSDAATSARVWNEILEAGKEFNLLACGLGARNTLRLEGALSLYGHEISDSITAWEAASGSLPEDGKRRFHRTRGAGKAAGGGSEAHAGRAGADRARHSPRRLQGIRSGGQRDRLCHQRFARAISQKNVALAYVPVAHVGPRQRGSGRDPRAKSEVQGHSDAVL